MIIHDKKVDIIKKKEVITVNNKEKPEPEEQQTVEVNQPDVKEFDHKTVHPDDYDNIRDDPKK